MTRDDTKSNTAETAAAVATFLALCFPLALPFAVMSWRWRRDRMRDNRTALIAAIVATAVFVAAVLLMRHQHINGWISLVHAVTQTAGGDGVFVSLVRVLPLSVVVGVVAGGVARDIYIASRKRHPIHGRALIEKEHERDRTYRAHQGTRRPAPDVLSGRPVLGVSLDGEPHRSWIDDNYLSIPDDAAHIVAIGATGSGKTQSILRIAAAHLALGWRVIVIDAKEDHETGAQFADIARSRGVRPERIRVWPHAGPMDLFRGDPTAIRDRLMACAGYTEPYYRAVAGSLLTLVTSDTPPPATLTNVLDRLDHTTIKSRWAGTDYAAIAAGLKSDDVQGVRYRYFDLNRQMMSVGAIAGVPGGWSWEDCDAAWITLPTSTRADAAASFGRALLVDLISYIRDGTRRDTRPILLIVEELGAIVSSDEETARLIVEAFERARSARVRTIVSVQTQEGLGPPEMQARILHSGAAVLAHRMPAPEAISEMLGTRYGLEASLGVDRDGKLLNVGSLREQAQFVLSPNVLRRLPVGQAVFIHGRNWCHVAVPLAHKKT